MLPLPLGGGDPTFFRVNASDDVSQNGQPEPSLPSVGESGQAESGLSPRGSVSYRVSSSLRDILCAEGPRVLQFLQQSQADPVLCCASLGYSFRVSMSRFASMPEERQRQLLQGMDSDAASDSTPDPGYLDDLYPGLEDIPSDNSGGEPSSTMSNSGGEPLSTAPNVGGDQEV